MFPIGKETEETAAVILHEIGQSRNHFVSNWKRNQKLSFVFLTEELISLEITLFPIGKETNTRDYQTNYHILNYVSKSLCFQLEKKLIYLLIMNFLNILKSRNHFVSNWKRNILLLPYTLDSSVKSLSRNHFVSNWKRNFLRVLALKISWDQISLEITLFPIGKETEIEKAKKRRERKMSRNHFVSNWKRNQLG